MLTQVKAFCFTNGCCPCVNIVFFTLSAILAKLEDDDTVEKSDCDKDNQFLRYVTQDRLRCTGKRSYFSGLGGGGQRNLEHRSNV